MTIDTLRLTAEEAAGLIERGEVSSAELVDAYRAAIGERDEELHAYLHVTEGEVPGDGVPIALKDVITTKGVPTTAASRILEGYIPVYDSTVASRVNAAGLPLLGKTNLDEFAMGSSTENSGFGPSKNPWDPERVPGGSSGGSAAAVAGGLAPWALGSDTGGSVKQPAALCGIVGLRPTYGTVSRHGIVPFASSLDQVGPMTKTVRDNARLYEIVAGRDPCDSTTVELPEPVALPTREDLKGLRIGIPKELNEAEGIEPGISESVNAAIRLAEELGASLGETTLPRSVEYGMACYYLVAPAEASANLARYDGVRYGHRAAVEGDLTELYERTRWEGFGEEPKRRIMLGTYALSAGYYDAYYGQAQKVRTMIKHEFAAAFENFDVLLSPTSPTVAFRFGEKTENPLAMYLADVLTIPPNMAGLPGPLDPVRPLRRAAGRPPDPRAAVLREPALRGRPRARDRARLRLRPGEARVSWEAVIGLEIHVQLKTRTKMFCRCANEWGAEPNTRTCPVCLAHPGALPVLNRQAVEWAIRLGLALGCEIATHSIFHRKNYFYPDLPKGYQISQYDSPLCSGGTFVVPGPEGDRAIGIVRAHLEEDAAKSIHVGGTGGRIHGSGSTLVDFNRGGTPLVEIVAEPDIRSPEEARRFLQLLRQTIVELGISDAEMDKGSLRCDANVSVREAGEEGYRTKTELKNMNSFKFVADGIAAEVARQVEVYESGGAVDQETLHFDPASGSITSLRSKEEAHDYRYFPEPDLVPLEPPAEMVDAARRRGHGDPGRAHPPLRVASTASRSTTPTC